MDENATPTVSEPDIADECDIRVAEHICEPDRLGLSLGSESSDLETEYHNIYLKLKNLFESL